MNAPDQIESKAGMTFNTIEAILARGESAKYLDPEADHHTIEPTGPDIDPEDAPTGFQHDDPGPPESLDYFDTDFGDNF